MSQKKIILCADDYGYNEPVSKAILQLIENKRINATSCMVNMPNWQQHAEQLKAVAKDVQIGLHLNLTEGEEAISHKKLVLRSVIGHIPYSKLSRLIERQFTTFFETMGHAPDFIDGHQHIHQLSGIRNMIVMCYSKYLKDNHCWVRLSANSINKMFLLPFPQKQLLIYWTGYKRLKRLLNVDRIPHNKSFAGVYDFEQHQNYREYFLQFLQHIDNQGLIMCHPGLDNLQTPCRDEIAESRVTEYHYFNSQQFVDDLASHNIALASRTRDGV
ncbi:MAG: ChbG/HpnK family deacetylase [Coxiellaceae bacterium]|nr:ChbG/HpnK family deacetylase [Coxiellaceae bacterium]